MQNTPQFPAAHIDPVCHMKVKPGEKSIKLTLATRTYYFCAEGCRNAFKADPAKYLIEQVPRRKGLWGRYLERLEKATNGKSMRCH